jgi:Na+/H+ antiporter NhaC
MRDKFKVNSRITVPAALLILILYVVEGYQVHAPAQLQEVEWLKVLPYLLVLVTAICGLNVTVVLVLGLISTALIGLGTGDFSIFDWFGAMGNGIVGMGELIIITLMAGGMLELIRRNGGIQYIIDLMTSHVKGKRGAEFSIAGLVSIANLCTANNTVAIITVGSIAHDIAERYHLDKRKCACILDMFSCLIQGIIPYGAQMLMAAELAKVSPLNIVQYLYYPMAMGVFAILSILFRYPRKYS